MGDVVTPAAVGFLCVLVGLAVGAFVVIELTDRESREQSRLVRSTVARWREAKARADKAERELAAVRAGQRPLHVRITSCQDN